ncbi:hypothetical protein MSG28_010857 [Choristoneura fumiferana]|uniref:Uncharacterized protein n=1 Tax=Choristoneura fumiferana TaxID=7141 RepID=A0ACC0KPL2_CHOFU|nr:hypothetical protein MSG28_010857 [Choristoneura fumiferana]
MKLLLALAALVALSAGSAIPLVPGDNSDYVEGESRYIWMPDGDGVPHLVDLQEPVDEALLNSRNGANNQYWLFTSNGNSGINPLITSAFLAVVDANVIVVDWRALANSNNATATNGVPGVGQFLGNFLVRLINTAGGNWNNVHLVGFSLGAHIVGSAGRTAGGRPVRVTGLDPACPLWSGNGNALNANAGVYVECIHTDGGLLGIHSAIGNADFYPNGGNNPQPGCWISTCSHSRSNPNNPQVIVNGNANTIWNSNYVASRPLKIIVHGWNGSGNSGLNNAITSAFLAVQDANVIVVDWRALAGSNYVTAVNGVPSVGQFLGNFIVWLRNTAGGVWTNVHLVGFSLGAHIVGVAGRTAGGRPVRVTGLDPAGPLWQTNSNAINRNSGVYVECIHTDGGLLGIFNPCGDADFYPNGGRNVQPGCGDSSCSHERAHDLFASSVRTNHFVGRLCGNLNQAQNNQCSGSTLNMGNGIVTKRGSGLYGLTTGGWWPY